VYFREDLFWQVYFIYHNFIKQYDLTTKFFIYYVGEKEENPRHYFTSRLKGYDLLEKNIMKEK